MSNPTTILRDASTPAAERTIETRTDGSVRVSETTTSEVIQQGFLSRAADLIAEHPIQFMMYGTAVCVGSYYLTRYAEGVVDGLTAASDAAVDAGVETVNGFCALI